MTSCTSLFLSLAADQAKAAREEKEFEEEIASIHAEVEAERLVQAAAKERLAVLLDDNQVIIYGRLRKLARYESGRLLTNTWLRDRSGW